MATIDLGELCEEPGPCLGPSRSRLRVARRPLWTAFDSLLVPTFDLAAAGVRTLDVITGAVGSRRAGAGPTLICQRTAGASFEVRRWSE
ncbi:hypothetical protein [Micromonospora sp. NPDC005367]|uniref:hypothetical protein n=1 Tax=Micromonospora sp. NPDC005367 TaxID=3155590 RepID=UPI0033A4DA0D